MKDIFQKLNLKNKEWESRDELPTKEEFIDESVVLERISDGELFSFSPNHYEEKDINLFIDNFIIPTKEYDKNKKCGSQYDFQTSALRIQKSMKLLNDKKITISEFSERHPNIRIVE